MKLSVIIPAYNELASVLTCLNSLQFFQSGTEVEYLVQDDCSPAYNPYATIRPEMASVERNASNLGFAGNCNAGAARAQGEVLFFVNQDVCATNHGELSGGWDATILAAFEDATVGIVGPRLLHPSGPVQNGGGFFDAKCQPFHRGLGYSDYNYHEVATPGVVSWMTGAALAVRRDLFVQVGGFDVAYVGGYWEDVDLCMQVRSLGFQVWYEPRATLVHAVGSTGGNPRFMQNALLWKRRWVDSGKVKPDVQFVKERFW